MIENFGNDSSKGLTLVMEKHGTHDQKTHGNWANGFSNSELEYPTQRSNPELKDALKDYVVEYPEGVGHESVNSYLRQQLGYDNITPEYKDKIKSRISELDKLVKLSPSLPEQTTAYRGIGKKFALELEAAGVGKSFTDNGFTSVSLDKGIAGGFPSRPTGNLLEIVLPAGTKAVNPFKFFTQHIISNTDLKNEQELILGRGTTFDIVEIMDNVLVGKIIKVVARK